MNAKTILAALGLFFALNAASAEPPPFMPEPVIVRVAVSDVVVVGKVTRIEDGTVKVLVKPDRVDFKVADVEVRQGLLGAEAGKNIRVAFPPAVNPLVAGQEVLLFLRRESGQSYYIPAPVFASRVDRKSDTFAEDLKQATVHAGLMADPDRSLRSKDAKIRYLTAAMLVLHYREPLDGDMKEVAIDADQSRRILRAMADADWKACPPEMFGIHPLTLFPRLGMTEKDGWKDRNTAEYSAAAEAWTKEHVDTFSIMKYVPSK
jgi:hypothetical protein